MKTHRKKFPYLNAEGDVDSAVWYEELQTRYPKRDLTLITVALQLCDDTVRQVKTPFGEGCVEQGIVMADYLANMDQDTPTLISALLYPAIQFSDLTTDDIGEWLGNSCKEILDGVLQMDVIHAQSLTQLKQPRTQRQNDNFRKMILAMVQDVRVVLVKLAEYLSLLELFATEDSKVRRQYALETREIYAPLANRLGLGEMKWQLEDWSFRFLEPEDYKAIAKQLDQQREEREVFVKSTIDTLHALLDEQQIQRFEVTGRAKHIYSIHKKMQQKNLNYSEIYDVVAVRILVLSIEDCYAVLGLVHSQWEHISKEFDDYIVKPKPNGYQSLHTAVISNNGRHFEVQIRTYDMHQKAELGLAAHWAYKEGCGTLSPQFARAQWLHQVIAWESDILQQKTNEAKPQLELADNDRVYVFTPKGEVIDLIAGATVLDFAYHIHSEIGHRCRGVKVNGKMVPLSYQVKMAEQVEVLTTKHHKPSRDWLNPKMGYLKTPRARSKVLHWFKHQNVDTYLANGRDILTEALQHTDNKDIDWNELAKLAHFHRADDLLIALGRGDYSVNQLINQLQSKTTSPVNEDTPPPIQKFDTQSSLQDIFIAGGENLEMHMAGCCKAVPGDPIIGYVTQGYGISIHHQQCQNVNNLNEFQASRLLNAAWRDETQGNYAIDLIVVAQDRPRLIHDIIGMLANRHINLQGIRSNLNAKHTQVHFNLTLELQNLEQLNPLLDAMKQISGIIDISRMSM